jgi:predicted AAA+ superfamily ATPase
MFKRKVIHLSGARQVGKSTLLGQLAKTINKPILVLNGDNSDVRQLFLNATATALGDLIKGHEVIFIDEAQRITNIGLALKLMIDNFPDKQIIATGSSAFELANEISEPLTGRKHEFMLFPVSFAEMVGHHGLLAEKRLLDKRLVFGYYPEVVVGMEDEKEVLFRLSDAYLYKDIFVLENLKKPQLVEKLLQALALQVGNEVSLTELGQLLNADFKTVEKYIDLLEKAYIVFRLPSLNRNLRTEIKKSRKIYFFDNGLRNAIIRNFNPMNARTDAGALWENFIIAERYKYTSYKRMWMNRFFWRTHTQQEIDYIEEYDGKLFAYEIKWNSRKKARLPKNFMESYKEHEFRIINPQNFIDFII